MSSALFDQVVAASGLSPIFAAGAISRACKKANVDPKTMTKKELLSVIPILQQAIAIYLRPEEVAQRMEAISALAKD